ncbi:MAG: DsrE/DsrF/DrsH-like family protein, partial [Sphaerochaeta sp.]|nr:DsrE/DsrF/DrsH-like family protein [Sphaerochaeta sp.]
GDDSLTLDACGLQCPGPIVSLKQKMDSLDVGERLIVKATDPGFRSDVKSWCQMTGNTLEGVTEDGGIITASIKKGEQKEACSIPVCTKAATIIVFSNDFDRALAAFVLANGAAASGKPVTMFFTFWGLSVLRKKPDHRVKKDFMGKMFGAMLPKNMDDLSLSSMNFCGMGPKMMKGRMKKKQVDQLKTMFQTAKQNNVRFIACQMSMDIMGITKDELLDGVEVGGVGTYMGEASKGDVNLFI